MLPAGIELASESAGIHPLKANATAMESGWLSVQNLPCRVETLCGTDDALVSIVRDIPSSDAHFPAMSHHALCVPLDIEVHKVMAWDEFRFSGQLRRGDVSVIPAGCSGHIRSEGRYTEALQIFLHQSYLTRLLQSEGETNHDTLVVIPTLLFRDQWLTELAARIRTEMIDRRPGGKIMIESLTTAFAMHFLRQMCSNPGPAYARVKSDTAAHKHVRRAIDFMHAHLAEDFGLTDLAQAAGCNLARLQRAFKDHIGEPPYRYLLRMRIERARHLLLHTACSVSEIAVGCGFNNQAHFTTAFARLIGESPVKWRIRNV